MGAEYEVHRSHIGTCSGSPSGGQCGQCSQALIESTLRVDGLDARLPQGATQRRGSTAPRAQHATHNSPPHRRHKVPWLHSCRHLLRVRGCRVLQEGWLEMPLSLMRQGGKVVMAPCQASPRLISVHIRQGTGAIAPPISTHWANGHLDSRKGLPTNLCRCPGDSVPRCSRQQAASSRQQVVALMAK